MLKEIFKNHTIILASGSPRRQNFFKELDLDFEIRLKEVDEIYPDSLKAEEITDFLAELKADAFNGTLSDKDILVTSDTIVWHEGKALGKPKDYDDAFRTLQSLSGKTHEVITSVSIRSNAKTDTFHEVTSVTFNELPDAYIKYYLDNYSPFDKAGSYGIQEWIGLVAISRIDGSYNNVVGLPVDKVFQHLLTFVV